MAKYKVAIFADAVCNATFYGLQVAAQAGGDYLYQNYIGNKDGSRPHNPYDMTSNLARQSVIVAASTGAYYVSKLVVEPVIKGIAGASLKKESVLPAMWMGLMYSMVKSFVDVTKLGVGEKIGVIAGPTLAVSALIRGCTVTARGNDIETYDGVLDAMKKTLNDSHPLSLSGLSLKVAALSTAIVIRAGIDTAIAKNITVVPAQKQPLESHESNVPTLGRRYVPPADYDPNKPDRSGMTGNQGLAAMISTLNEGVLLIAQSIGPGTRHYWKPEQMDEEMALVQRNQPAIAAAPSRLDESYRSTSPPPYQLDDPAAQRNNLSNDTPPIPVPPPPAYSRESAPQANELDNNTPPIAGPSNIALSTNRSEEINSVSPPGTCTPQEIIDHQLRPDSRGLQSLFLEIQGGPFGSLNVNDIADVQKRLIPEEDPVKAIGGTLLKYHCPTTDGKFVAKGGQILVINNASFQSVCKINLTSGKVEGKPPTQSDLPRPPPTSRRRRG